MLVMNTVFIDVLTAGSKVKSIISGVTLYITDLVVEHSAITDCLIA